MSAGPPPIEKSNDIDDSNMAMDEYNNQFPYQQDNAAVGGNDVGDDIINNLSDAYS